MEGTQGLTRSSHTVNDDLGKILKGWQYDPTDETANVRVIKGPDGVEKVQLRIRFGLLQIFADATPETGGISVLEDIKRELAEHRAKKRSDKGFSINALRTAQASQEIMDYYQRRICFFLLGDYRRARRDAEHNLEILSILKKYSVDEKAVLGHDRYRAFMLMDRARASAMVAVEDGDLKGAVAEIDKAIGDIQNFYRAYSRPELEARSNEIEVLRNLKADLRSDHEIELSERERLDILLEEQSHAIAREDYEKAARLRDEIERLSGRSSS